MCANKRTACHEHQRRLSYGGHFVEGDLVSLIQDDHAVRARTPQAGCKIRNSAIEHQTAFDPPKPACIIRSFIGDLTRSTCSTSFATTEPLQNDHYFTDQIGSPRQLSSPKISFGQLFLFECFFDKLNFLFVGQIFIHDSY
jgi:hypothetical protein